MDAKDVIQDIEERSMVAWLKFERSLSPVDDKIVLKETREAMGFAWRTGYRVAMMDAVKMRMG